MLEWTGERYLPWIREQSTIAYEHLHRYAYATTLVKDKRVLDLACGEGYGSKLLATTAASVVGIDIDETVIRHALEKYGSSNLQFLPGSIASVPLRDDHSFDVIVCFEAIEHIENQDALLAEVQRLLRPGGVFFVSTPNKAIYHDEARDENPFHLKELYFDEFQSLLTRHFAHIQFLGQRIHPSSSIWPIGTSNCDGFREFAVDRGPATDFEFIERPQRVPLYFIAVASDEAAALSLPGSVLVDQSDSLIKEKDAATRWREEQIAERDETIQSLEDAVKWRETQIAELTTGLEWTQNRATELEKSVASQDQALEWRAQQVAELETAKDFWERESTTLTARLQGTERRLAVASDTLAGIYASRGWKFILKLRRIRDAFRGPGKSRA